VFVIASRLLLESHLDPDFLHGRPPPQHPAWNHGAGSPQPRWPSRGRGVRCTSAPKGTRPWADVDREGW